MSVLNQKMDEQMPYFKPGKEGKSREVAGCHTCTREKVCCDYGLWVLGPLPLRHCIRPLKCAPVCPKHKQGFHTQTPDSRLRAARPVRLFIINTKKTPRTNCSAPLAPVPAPAAATVLFLLPKTRLGMRKLP